MSKSMFWHESSAVAHTLKVAPLIERVRSVGFLPEALAQHLKQGGLHLAVVDRQDLVAAGVPLRRAVAKPKGESRPPSGFTIFL